MNELQGAEVFLQIVRSNGISGAARALGRSASTLSRALAGLEATLGMQLLARTTRSLHLTEAGDIYRAHAERIVAETRAAHDALAELRAEAPRGHLRVSMPITVGERLLAPHLPAFRARYPDLRLAIDLSDRKVSLVEGGFDLAIRVGRPVDSSLRALLLGRIPGLLVASPGYLRARGVPRTPSELQAHACIGVGPHPGPVEWTLYRGARRARVSLEASVHTSSATFAVQLAANELGLVRTAEWLVRDELRDGKLVEVMRPWSCEHPKHGGVPVYVIYAQSGSTAPPRKSRVFVELIQRIMRAELPPSRTAAGKTTRRRA